ncbi:MAG: hypothetical protein J1E62_01680 [Lachnospiraceae bacterium]|nr:hypothetical protein [Lachnospiraceae bacterium]
MANPNGKKGIGDREMSVLLILAAIAILALAWFMGLQKFNEKRAVVVAENEQLQKEVNELDAKRAKEASTKEDTEEKRHKVEELLGQYPYEIRTQTVIDRYDQLEKKVKGLTVETEAFTMNQIFFMGGVALESLVAQNTETPDANADANANADAGTGAEGETNEGSTSAVDYIGYRSDSVVTFNTNYDSLKTIINFINQYPYRMNVREIDISSETGSKPLKCSMTVSMYSVGGREETEDIAYRNPTWDVPTSKKDIFNK